MKINPYAVLKQYLPVIALVVASLLSALQAASSDNVITGTELVNLIVATLGAIVLYVVPRLPGRVGYVLKTIVVFLIAALQALVSVMSDGVTLNEWTMIGLTALAAIGVAASTKYVPETVPVQANAKAEAVVVTMNGADVDAGTINAEVARVAKRAGGDV